MDLAIRLSSGQTLDRPPQIFLAVSLWIILLSGGALWLFGRSVYHVGASNVLFGYFGYLVARG